MTANRDLAKLVPLPTVSGQFVWDQATNKWLQATKAMVGLGSVDNTADSAKPVSVAQQDALDAKAPLANPVFTGGMKLGSSSNLGAGLNYPVQFSASGNAGIALARFTADANGPLMAFAKSRSTSGAVGAQVTSSDLLGAFQFWGDNGSSWSPAGQFGALVDGTPSSNSIPGAIYFSTTAQGGTNFIERLRIKNNGRMLVGTTADDSVGLLQVSGPVTSSGPLKWGQYTLTTLPSASAFSGCVIDVTNAAGGPKTCRSDGTNWKILNTTTTVS